MMEIPLAKDPVAVPPGDVQGNVKTVKSAPVHPDVAGAPSILPADRTAQETASHGQPLRSSLMAKLGSLLGDLSPITSITPEVYRGPTPWSNWLIPGKVLTGCYPGAVDDETQIENILALLGVGIDCIVCLQNEMDHNTPRNKWSKGSRRWLRPYIDDMRYVAEELHKERGDPEVSSGKERIVLIQVNMIEGDTVDDGVMDKVMKTILRQLEQGRGIYIHGWLGHGRVGTMAAILLNRLYGLESGLAINYAQAVHDTRECLEGIPRVKVPSTTKQRTQVTRMCKAANTGGVYKDHAKVSTSSSPRRLPRTSVCTLRAGTELMRWLCPSSSRTL